MAINRENWVRSIVPAGTVIAFAGVTPPTGWLLCDGSVINRSAYLALFTAISIAHGSGDGSTTFHLPDYQGRFLRGVANGSVNDPDKLTRIAAATGGNIGNAVGSVQSEATRKNGLNVSDPGHSHSIDVYYNNSYSVGGSTRDWNSGGILDPRNSNSSTSGVTLLNGDNETRPKNANVNYIIKA